MLTILLIVGAIVVASVATSLAMAARAPEGYQDADGFHLGPVPDGVESVD